MKKQSLLFYLLFTAVALSAQVPNYVPTNGLVGWYPFTGNANDASGLGTNGVVSNAVLANDRNNNPNQAYYFNGTNAIINLGINNSINSITSDITLSYWIRLETGSQTAGNNVIASYSNQGGSAWRIISGVNRDSLRADMGLVINSNWNVTNSPQNSISFNQWYHIVHTRTVTVGKTYINGVLVGTSTFASQNINNPTSPAATTKIGCNWPSSSNGIGWFKGSIDDIGFWSRALTQQEITNLYNSSTCPPTTATIIPNGNTTFCQGGSVVLQASAGSSYNWSNGSTNQSITASQSNNYTVTVTDGNGCTATASQLVMVNPNPTVSFSLPTITCNTAPTFPMNGNPSGGSYTGAGVSGNNFNPANAGLGLKSVNYTYTNGNGCSGSASSTTLVYDTTGVVCTSYDTVTTYLSVTDTLKINVNLTGINPPNNNNLVSLYPNPAKDHLMINLGNYSSMNGYTVKITNALGQIVFNQPVTQQQFYIDLSTWGGAGTYIMYIADQNQTVKSQKQIVLQ